MTDAAAGAHPDSTRPATHADDARPSERPAVASTAEEEALALARRIVDLASDKKASDIVLLEVGGLTTLADYFVICSGQSERQLGAIADGIIEGVRDEGTKPIGREGSAERALAADRLRLGDRPRHGASPSATSTSSSVCGPTRHCSSRLQ